ncbi:MAG: hypothetical protein C5B49_11670 [Bdellovibrio sp.]|nr:MAG: hypothetical protein C5B49_11670 [Bdellovibrio sp.]
MRTILSAVLFSAVVLSASASVASGHLKCGLIHGGSMRSPEQVERVEQMNSSYIAGIIRELSRGFLSTKFTYVDEGAKMWRKMMKNSRKREFEDEIAQITLRLKEVEEIEGLQEIEETERFEHDNGHLLNIVYIGPGDSEKLIGILHSVGVRKQTRSLVVDFSQGILDWAQEKVASEFKMKLYLHTMQMDLEEHALTLPPPFQQGPSVFLLLGQTLGNPRDRHNFLKNIRAGIPLDGRIFVGVYLYDREKTAALVSEYRDPTYIKMDNWLLEKFGLIDGVNGRLVVEFDEAHRNIRGFFEVTKPTEVIASQFGSSGSLHLGKGALIEVFQSHRFTPPELNDLFVGSGLRILSVDTIHDSDYALVQAVPIL